MKRRQKSSKVTLIISILFLLFFIWILLQFLATIALPYQSVNNLDGNTGLIDNQEKLNNMTSPWNSIYGCGDILCHQKVDRSFSINGNEMPFCARCTAIWLGIAIGLGFIVFYKINLDEKFIILMFICLFPIGIDGFGQLFGLWESNNIIRLITGLLVGIISGIASGIIVDEVNEIILSRKTKSS
jgi:uncharacterized membrane protein